MTAVVVAIVPAGVAAAAAQTTEPSGRSYYSVRAEKQFSWADAGVSPFDIGATVAIVHMRTPRAALRSIAPRSATPIESPRKVERWAEHGPYQQVRNSIEALPLGNHWTLIVNELGFRVTLPRVLRRLSAHGYAYVMFEDAEANTEYQVARHGTTVRDFDPMLYDRPWTGRPSKIERHIRFGDRRDWHTMAKCMLLTYRLSGIRLSPKILTSQRRRLAVGVRG